MKHSLEVTQNPLYYEDTKKLITQFAIPSVISFLVGALYNIVDQIFIGRSVGIVGNAATNVAFPITPLALSLALIFSVGASANFNLCLGADEKEKAGHYAGNGLLLLVVSGLIVMTVVRLFLTKILFAFGADDAVFSYAKIYTDITSLGIPFLILSIGGGNIIRADGSPKYSMFCTVIGAILNTILDPLFIFGFNMGMAGAAWATVIGQVISSLLVINYLLKFKHVKLSFAYMKPRVFYIKNIIALGFSAFLNQIATMLVQIAMNNVLRHYGKLSVYGSAIPLAAVGIISKVNIIVLGFLLGIAQGTQPIFGFNYGAKRFDRVKSAYFEALTAASVIAVIAFLSFQIFPKNIIQIFGNGSEDYYRFSIKYFRVFMLMTAFNGIVVVSSFMFTAIGKAKLGALLAMTRQILFLLPLIIILPSFWGIEGVMYAGPIADLFALILTIYFVYKEIKLMNKNITKQKLEEEN